MVSHRPLSGCDGHHIFAQFGPGPLHDGKQSVSHHERPLGDALLGFRVSSGLVLHGKCEDSCAGDQRQDRQRARPRHAADAARRRRRGNRVSCHGRCAPEWINGFGGAAAWPLAARATLASPSKTLARNRKARFTEEQMVAIIREADRSFFVAFGGAQCHSRILDRWTATQVAPKAPQRKRPCRSRALSLILTVRLLNYA
jgi:hypothetical protein